MKKTELAKSIKEEIFKILAEADQEDIDAQSDLNKELETTKGHKDDLGDALSESLNPEVLRDVNRYIARTAKRYDYSEQDAVYAIMAALEQRKSDKKYEIPGFEGTMDALDSISIREEDDEDEMDKKALKAAKKGDSVSKIANKLQQTVKEMKQVVRKYKDAEEPEKSKLLARLKELTKIKKELEGLL
jgi:LysM repeat protein